MTLRDHIAIGCTPEEAWAVLADPSLMPLWNPKCVDCESLEGPIGVGTRYKATFRLKGPEQETSCEVIQCLPAQLLRTRYSGAAFSNRGYVDETFRLTATPTGTRLAHAVDFAHSGIPWVFQVLMKLINLFGHNVGPSLLENIRELACRGEDHPRR